MHIPAGPSNIHYVSHCHKHMSDICGHDVYDDIYECLWEHVRVWASPTGFVYLACAIVCRCAEL